MEWTTVIGGVGNHSATTPLHPCTNMSGDMSSDAKHAMSRNVGQSVPR